MKNKLRFDYSRLLGKIKEKGFTQEEFATALNITPATLSLKLSGQGYFKQLEIDKAKTVLGMEKEEIGAFFYTEKV